MATLDDYVNICPDCGKRYGLKYDDKNEASGRGFMWCKCGYRSANASSKEEAALNVAQGKRAEITVAEYATAKVLHGLKYALLACLILPVTVLIDLVRRQK